MIELIVVMTIIALLLSIAMPRYMDSLERGKDQIVAHDLAQMRKAIDQYFGDKGVYPDRLEDLVTNRYLRALPVNPHTELPDWIVVPPPNRQKGGVYDVQAPPNPNLRALPGTSPDAVAAPADAAASDGQP